MGRNGKLLVLAMAIGGALPAGAAALSAEGPHGRRITVSTGTGSGDCARDGHRLVCIDGDRIAVASLEIGCETAEGGAICEVAPPRRGRVSPEDGVEVECETGAKKGYIYLITDSEGKALCVQNYDGYGRVNGGTCFKGRETCASVNCDHGCEGASLNCGCHIRSRPRQTVSTAD